MRRTTPWCARTPGAWTCPKPLTAPVVSVGCCGFGWPPAQPRGRILSATTATGMCGTWFRPPAAPKPSRYEYGPFGEPLRLTGPAARSNPFRFSTKRIEGFTGLVLYEYRPYSPISGRWLSRDPVSDVSLHATGNIDPHGLMPQFKDVNAFSAVQNDPTTAVDNLGLFCCRGVWYNPFTHCCRNGKVTKRGVVDTGYRKCSSPTQTQPKVDHVWPEWDGGSAGFYPNGATDGTLPGQVQNPDPASQSTGKKCDPIRLDPCHYDIDAFRSCLQQYIDRTSMKPPIYHTSAIVGENCQTWSAGGVRGCAYDAWYDKYIQGI